MFALQQQQGDTVRVLISGYYGFGNLGDEALLEVIVRQLRERFPALDLEVLSATPQATSAAYNVASVSRWQWRSVREAIGRADVVVSGGGGLLQSATSIRSLIYYVAILRDAIRAKRKTMIFAQSVGPLDGLGRFIVSRYCRGLKRATVRDERSRELLQSLLPQTPVERTSDPVFLYDAPDADVDLSGEGLGPESGPYAVVSVRKATGLQDGGRVVARAVDRLATVHGIRTAFLPLGGIPDAEVSTAIIRQCSSAPVLLPESTLPIAAAVLRDARVVVGMRLHALILAARYAVPFLAIPYDPKVASLCSDLGYPLDALWTPGRPKPDDETVDALVDRLVGERNALLAHLSERVEAVRRLAERNFDVLDELMKE
ncbi:MAG TPA: polysaccharide pyruvyl transferase CsaB [Candidatus Baltobacteraceae bacterium]|nr:polysaccharide pyruvyl transferase CsaB [Candidatus Baltobacteraceae bacterium]